MFDFDDISCLNVKNNERLTCKTISLEGAEELTWTEQRALAEMRRFGEQWNAKIINRL